MINCQASDNGGVEGERETEQKPFACLVKSSLMLNPSFPRQWGWVGRDLVLKQVWGSFLMRYLFLPSFLQMFLLFHFSPLSSLLLPCSIQNKLPWVPAVCVLWGSKVCEAILHMYQDDQALHFRFLCFASQPCSWICIGWVSVTGECVWVLKMSSAILPCHSPWIPMGYL